MKEAALIYFKVVLGLTSFIALFSAQSAFFRAIGEKNQSDVQEYRKWSCIQSAVSMTFVF
ncbi:hypothetical protein COI44_03540 [Bacillus sp. AFS088145]|nr:hypothetical protein COI44_03540 [Bacillus sp. AFS088145]